MRVHVWARHEFLFAPWHRWAGSSPSLGQLVSSRLILYQRRSLSFLFMGDLYVRVVNFPGCKSPQLPIYFKPFKNGSSETLFMNDQLATRPAGRRLQTHGVPKHASTGKLHGKPGAKPTVKRERTCVGRFFFLRWRCLG